MFYEVIPTRVFRNDSKALTYRSDLKLVPGSIVIIPLGKSSCPGIVLKKVPKPNFICKPISKLLYDVPLPEHLLKTALWLSSYYLSPLPSCASLLLPIGIGKKRRKTIPESAFRPDLHNFSTDIELNSAQLKSLKGIEQINNSTKVLFGVTGSGKTNIYLKLAQKNLKRNQSVILLVPEIALTSQLVQVFESTFEEKVILLHSKQTEAERHQIWENLLQKETPTIVIGPRSALLAPLHNLGLIIIDESHESTYYQENTPKYSALRLASYIAKILGISCIFGSATPLVSDFYLAKTKNSLIFLTEKAKATAIAPDIRIIDFTSRTNFSKNQYFSDPLLAAIKSNLENNRQTLIYHNRRGSAPITICEKCGWQALCPNCFLPLTLHTDSYSLLCHTCGYKEKIPSSCPDCHHPSILHKGFGTKLLEAELRKLFPDIRIARFDADNKKNETLDSLYNDVKNGSIKIIIGTQTVSRGLDLPHLATIGVVQADAGLSLPDFSSEEKTFELLTQVIGRVGRGHLDTASVYIQTYQPNSPVINYAIKSDYLGFFDYMIKKRKKQYFPPFSYLAKLTVTFKTEKSTITHICSIANILNEKIAKERLSSIVVSPPTPCFHERTPSGFSWQLILKAKKRSDLIGVLSIVQENAHISLDPPSLL